MSFNYTSSLPPRLEHIEAVLDVLQDGGICSPKAIVETTKLTLTQVNGALTQLERIGKIRVVRQDTTPKIQVALQE